MTLVCLIFMLTFCSAAKASSVDSVNIIFAGIKRLPALQRPDAAMKLHKDHDRAADEATSMKRLDGLAEMARDLNDKPLENAVFEMRADYYSVNRGFNAMSTMYYQKAIDFAVANNDIVNTGVYQHKIGVYYFVFKRNVDACKHFLEAQDIFKKAGYKNVPNIAVYLNQEATFYYELGDNDNAALYLTEALKYPITDTRIHISTINTLGLICRANRQLDKAVVYFNNALNISRQHKDTAWIAIARGNIGSVLFLQGNYARALPYIITDYTTSLKYGEKVNAALALLRLIRISMAANDIKKASQQLSEAGDLIKGIRDGLKLRIDLYDLKAQLYERSGDLNNAIAYRKSMEQARDSLQQRNNVAAVERVRLGWEMANHQLMLDKLKNEAEIGKLKRNLIIMGLVTMVIISVLIYNQQMLKVRKDKSILISEKQQVDEELKNAASALLLYTESLRKKNAVIEYFRKEITRLEKQVENKDEAENLEKLMQAHIMTDENWDEFRTLFAKVHTGFFSYIKNNFPGLSGADTRILTLMKLQLSNREMANMLGITVEGIKKAKQRLRKKMSLPNDTDIEKAIAGI